MLTALFKSLIEPLVVMFAIPFGFIGVVIGHAMFNYNIQFLSKNSLNVKLYLFLSVSSIRKYNLDSGCCDLKIKFIRAVLALPI